jgi:hypothetical protein
MRFGQKPEQAIVPSADHHPLLRRFWSRCKKKKETMQDASCTLNFIQLEVHRPRSEMSGPLSTVSIAVGRLLSRFLNGYQEGPTTSRE